MHFGRVILKYKYYAYATAMLFYKV